jgi:hypothetical protein
MQNFPTPFALWRNGYTDNLSSVSYPIREIIHSPADLKRAVTFDHVFAEFKDGVNKYGQPIYKHRKNANYLWSDVIALDVDNSDTDNPDEWITIERLQSDFSDVEFYIATSRNHQKIKIKDGVTQKPRPKFHLYFPITKVNTTAEYTKLKKLTVTAFSYFDPNAVDCARVFIGNPNAETFFFSGQKKLSQFILEKTQNNSINFVLDKAPKYRAVSVILQGERNSHMHTVACNLLYRFGNTAFSIDKYRTESQKCSPLLDNSELQKIWESSLSWYNSRVIPNPNYIRPQDFADVSKQETFAATTAGKNVWQTPRPIAEIVLSKFPVEHFPRILSEYILAVSEFSETATEMCGVLVLGVLGGVFQRKYEIISTAGNTETLSIFSLIIAEPAERKSGVVKRVIRPLAIFEREYNENARLEISENKAAKKILQKKLETAEKDDDEQEIYKLQSELDNFAERLPISLMTDDSTPEALVKKMKEQGERTIITASEGGFFKRIKGRYTPNGDDKEIYLKAHSGDRHSVDRIGRPSDVPDCT